mgnify:CR=1 FL=1
MKIAIVDDSSLDRDFLKNGLEIIFEERNIENLEIQHNVTLALAVGKSCLII